MNGNDHTTLEQIKALIETMLAGRHILFTVVNFADL
jgi:hypothetical protein